LKSLPKSDLKRICTAALVPAVAAAMLSPFLGIYVFIVAFLLASLVGYPIYLLLRRYRLVTNGWVSSLVGLLVGSGFAAFFFWPSKYPDLKTTSWRGSADNKVYTMIDGVPTQAAWDGFYLACGISGIVGALAGLCFWLFSANPRLLDDPKRPKALGMSSSANISLQRDRDR
jgi:hypothetical protein